MPPLPRIEQLGGFWSVDDPAARSRRGRAFENVLGKSGVSVAVGLVLLGAGGYEFYRRVRRDD